MKQVSLGLMVILCLGLPIPAAAQTPTDNYVSQLVELGYADIRISRTFLGRYQILATRKGVTRELIVARNGQILFDYLDNSRRWASNPNAAPSSVAENFPQPNPGGNSGKTPAGPVVVGPPVGGAPPNGGSPNGYLPGQSPPTTLPGGAGWTVTP